MIQTTMYKELLIKLSGLVLSCILFVSLLMLYTLVILQVLQPKYSQRQHLKFTTRLPCINITGSCDQTQTGFEQQD